MSDQQNGNGNPFNMRIRIPGQEDVPREINPGQTYEQVLGAGAFRDNDVRVGGNVVRANDVVQQPNAEAVIEVQPRFKAGRA